MTAPARTYASELHSARCEAALNGEAADRLLVILRDVIATVDNIEATAAVDPDFTFAAAVERLRLILPDTVDLAALRPTEGDQQ